MSRDSILLMNTRVDADFSQVPVWNTGDEDVALVPGNLMRWPGSREIELEVVVHSVTGAPSSASLSAELWVGGRYVSGPGFANPTFRPFTEDELATKVVEGTDFGVVATHSLAAPVTVSRTLRHPGIMPRLRLVPDFTGGTNPAFIVSVFAYAKD